MSDTAELRNVQESRSLEMSELISVPLNDNDPAFVPQTLYQRGRTASWFQRLTQPRSLNTTRTRDSQSPDSDNDELAYLLRKTLNRFCFAVTGSVIADLKHRNEWEWFCAYLEAEAVSSWAVCAAVLKGLTARKAFDGMRSRWTLYSCFAVVAECLYADGDVYFATIVEALQKEGVIAEGVSNDLLLTFVFQTIGWITALWDPAPDPDVPRLRLRPLRVRNARTLRSARRTTSLNILETSHQNVRRIANRFGALMPVPLLNLEEDMWRTRDVESASITTTYISFHSLRDLVNIKLLWTSTLAEHLTYDPRTKTLHVFKHPSICLLTLRKQGDTLLSQMFEAERKEKAESEHDHYSAFAGLEDYSLELLQSYRLIFASHKQSRQAIAQNLQDLAADVDETSVPIDPLLKLLCTADASSSEIDKLYQELGLESHENWVAISQFTFLANKLLYLQAVSMGHSPTNLRRMWNDRRNPTTWFALWAVLMITTATLIFQFLQFLFQLPIKWN